ncbi:MAG: MFS transporter, partial [Planctomycetes bacterium]|nr:MFS transporter [Planctomycetota bacterium]
MHATARTALLYASAGHALCHGSKLVLAVGLLSAAAEFGVGRDGLGLALGAYGVGIGLAAVPAGLLSDRIGPTRVLHLYLWSLAAAALACFWAPTLPTFTLAHAALGAAAGLYHPPGLSLLSLSSAREERGPVMGWHGVLGQLGPVAA